MTFGFGMGFPRASSASGGSSLDLQFAGATTLDPLITFIRPSTGTYFDSAGVLQSAAVNLVTYSQDFSNAAWTKANVTASSGSTAPNGTATGFTVTGAAGTSIKRIRQSVTSTQTTWAYSVFLKAGTEPTVLVYAQNQDGTAYARALVTFATGTIATQASVGVASSTSSIAAVGNGWYLVSLVWTFSVAPTSVFSEVWLDGFASTASTGTFLAWGAQLQVGSVSTTYIQTFNTVGGAPRFDYSPTTLAAQGLLIEEARTNSNRNNTMVGAATGTPGTTPTNWTVTNVANGISREIVAIGVEDGINYIDIRFFGTASATGNHAITTEASTQIAAASGQSWSGSAYVRLIAGSLASLVVTSRVNGRDAAGALLESVGSVTLTPTSAALRTQRAISTGTLANALSVFVTQQVVCAYSSGAVVDITLRIGLPQLELGAFATSVIPTTTVAATRSRDDVYISTLTPWYNQSEGTLFAEIGYQRNGTVASFNDNTANNRWTATFSAAALGQALRNTAGAGLLTTSTANAAAVGTTNKIALAISTGCSLALNGGTVATNASYAAPLVTQLQIGNQLGAGYLNGYLRALTYYPSRLSNTQLQTLTAGPSLNLQFAGATTLDPLVTFTRASTGTYFDSAGVLQSAAINAARFDYDPSTLAARGLLIEGARTNSIRNNTMVGAVAGTPGTAPTNWAIGLGGLTQEIVGTGSFNGVSYIDVRLSGTTTGVAASILLETVTGVPWTNTQVFTLSAWWQIVGGSAANITSPALSVNGYDASSVFLSGAFTSGGQVGSLSTTWQRITRTFTGNNAALAYGRPLLSMSFAVGAAIDITLRIGLPQLELGAFATSAIPTTTAAATRAQDFASVNTLTPWYNATQGTLYAAYTPSATGLICGAAALSDGTQLNRMLIRAMTASNQTLSLGIDANVSQWALTFTGATTATTKSVLGYKPNDIAFTRNGESALRDASATIPVVNRLVLGGDGDGSFALNGHLQSVIYYPSRLSNAELQELTT